MNISDLTIKQENFSEIAFFDETPQSIDKSLNSTIQEKTRRFNNACLNLYENILNAEKVFPKCTNSSSNINDNIYRKFVRNIYLELFIYQEKIMNLICNIYFIKSDKSSKNKIKMRSKYFKELANLYDKCSQLLKDDEYLFMLNVRDDEVHNMSRIDSYFMDLIKDNDGNAKVIYHNYKISAEELSKNYNYVILKLIDIKNDLQVLFNCNYLWKVYNHLKSKGEEIWIN